ncbi:Glycopeptide [Mycena sanguinolenta]|uniref:Glycopeptide n=1 Tax=Mycena sanguinolenta TaxID=230812 RepID=A0A8H6ZAR7_9AGAR|nr:Glycopeptide [Mycena sanguinolenta]
MFSCIKAATLAVIAVATGTALAETHTITFVNKWVRLPERQNGAVLSTGAPYTSNGPIIDAIAYLQTGSCGFNGEGCIIVEINLQNPTTPGSGSTTDLSLIPPHAFSVTTGFAYLGACAPAGADCTNANCPAASINPNGTPMQVSCQADDTNLVITFCD